jgi:hypothetical protein
VIGEEVIARSCKKSIQPDEWEYFEGVRAIVQYYGLPVFSMQQGNASTFHDIWKRHYPKLFPCWQDLINLCVEKQFTSTDLIGCEDAWHKVFAPHLPSGIIPGLRGYIASRNRDVLYDGKFLAGQMTYKHLFETLWSDSRLPGCPARSLGFVYPCVEENGENWQMLSEDGKPWLCYDPGNSARNRLHGLSENIQGGASWQEMETVVQ